MVKRISTELRFEGWPTILAPFSARGSALERVLFQREEGEDVEYTEHVSVDVDRAALVAFIRAEAVRVYPGIIDGEGDGA